MKGMIRMIIVHTHQQWVSENVAHLKSFEPCQRVWNYENNFANG